jgi:hypothetical protein
VLKQNHQFNSRPDATESRNLTQPRVTVSVSFSDESQREKRRRLIGEILRTPGEAKHSSRRIPKTAVADTDDLVDQLLLTLVEKA